MRIFHLLVIACATLCPSAVLAEDVTEIQRIKRPGDNTVRQIPIMNEDPGVLPDYPSQIFEIRRVHEGRALQLNFGEDSHPDHQVMHQAVLAQATVFADCHMIASESTEVAPYGFINVVVKVHPEHSTPTAVGIAGQFIYEQAEVSYGEPSLDENLTSCVRHALSHMPVSQTQEWVYMYQIGFGYVLPSQLPLGYLNVDLQITQFGVAGYTQ